MSDTDYIPSPAGWCSRKQVEKIEATGDTVGCTSRTCRS